MPLKILVVDDEPDISMLVTQQFEEKIESGEMEFYFAQNGQEALEKLKANPDMEIVLADINMPVMDGIAMLDKLNQINPTIKTIMVSAYSDMGNIRKAMNKGAFDFLIKPINFEDLKLTIRRTAEASKEHKATQSEHEHYIRIQKELEVAKKIQEAILPHNFKPLPENDAFEIFGKSLPSRAVGGDFFDFFPLTPTKLAIAIADVSEKGVPAALFMAMTRAAIRCFASKDIPPTECLNQVNRFLCAENESSMFATVFYGELETENGKFCYCNAGHLPPFVLTSEGLQQIGKYEGISLGIVQNPHLKEKTLQLKKNDTVVLYTDGVTEAMNNRGQMYTEQRLMQFLENHKDKPVVELTNLLMKNIEEFTKTELSSDDITILCLKFLMA